MFTIEERVEKIVEANWGDKPALIHKLALELHSFRAAMPSAGDLESIAYNLEITGGKDVVSPDGTFFDASLVLRRAADLIRLAINEQLESGQ
jgi:hypothetical protein